MTIIELVLTVTLMSLVLGGVCETYVMVNREWQHQQGEEGAMVACTQACSRIGDYVKQAYQVRAVDRFATGDALAVNMPANSAYGIYVPSDPDLRYHGASQWVLFYLSDISGSYQQSGDILWAATFSVWVGSTPAYITPDPSWSMYYNTQNGRIQPMASLGFSVNTSGAIPKLVMSVTSSYRLGGAQKQMTLSRTFCVRNTSQ